MPSITGAIADHMVGGSTPKNDTERPRRDRRPPRSQSSLDDWRRVAAWAIFPILVFLGIVLWRWSSRPPTQIINEAAPVAPVEQPADFGPTATEEALARLDPFAEAPYPLSRSAAAMIGIEPDLEQPTPNIARSQFVFFQLAAIADVLCDATIAGDAELGLKVFPGEAPGAVPLFECADPVATVDEILRGDVKPDDTTTTTEVSQ